MAARINKIFHDADTRNKIRAAHIIRRFSQCLDGTITLDAGQISCGKTLLNKVLPDLQAVALDGRLEHEAGDGIAALFAAINGKTRTLYACRRLPYA